MAVPVAASALASTDCPAAWAAATAAGSPALRNMSSVDGLNASPTATWATPASSVSTTQRPQLRPNAAHAQRQAAPTVAGWSGTAAGSAPGAAPGPPGYEGTPPDGGGPTGGCQGS